MFKIFVLTLRIEACSYCVVLHRRTSYQFVSVPIGSYRFVVHSYRFVVHSHQFGIRRYRSAATQYVAIQCATIALSYWIAHVRIGSCKFLLVPIVFSSHHSTIVLILHHHRTASYCIVSPSSDRVAFYCISLHRINSCLIRVWFALIRK